MVDPASDLGWLADAIRDARVSGWTWLAIAERVTDSEADSINQVLSLVELSEPASGWTSVSRDKAAETIARFLWQPIPFGFKLMPMPQSMAFAATFLESFAADARFVTNLADPPFTSGWSPVTAHTFDACVIGLDVGRVGLICGADED